MSKNPTLTKELTVTLKSGKEVTTEVTVTGTYDSNYGADADGNRGMGAWFIDDVQLEMPNLDDKGNELTFEEQWEFSNLIDQAIDDRDWEFDDV